MEAAERHRRFFCAGCGNDWMTVLPEIDTCQICYHRSQLDIEPRIGAKVYIVTAINRCHWQTLAVVAASIKDASEKFSAYLADCQYKFDVNEIGRGQVKYRPFKNNEVMLDWLRTVGDQIEVIQTIETQEAA